MRRRTLLRHLRATVLFYKRRKTVDQIANMLSYSPLYVRKVLNSETRKLYIMQLTNGFIQKARAHFDAMVAEIQSGEYTKNNPQ